MLGAIIGDRAGSNYEIEETNWWYKKKTIRPYEERIKIMNSQTPLFASNSSFTDDTCWTCAIYDAIINGNNNYESYLRAYGVEELKKGKDRYGRNRFGPGSVKWLLYQANGTSIGNGSAMRISPVGFLFNSLEEVKRESYLATIPSHNSKEAIKGAECVAVSIYLLRTGTPKEVVKKYVEENYYNLNFDLEELRHTYTFHSTTEKSVPQALFCFFQSTDFENAIRVAISIGGDTDTIASITGALAESYYGIPEEIKQEVFGLLDSNKQALLSHEYFLQSQYKKGKLI